MGAPLEQAAHMGAYAFGLLPETRMMSTFLRRRSSGLENLYYSRLLYDKEPLAAVPRIPDQYRFGNARDKRSESRRIG